jgi:hypothetical protein
MWSEKCRLRKGFRILAALASLGMEAACNHTSSQGQSLPPPLRMELSPYPADTITVSQLREFQLNFTAETTDDSIVDFQMDKTILDLNGSPAADWEFIASNGLCAEVYKLGRGQKLNCGFGLQDRYFKSKGTYAFVWKYRGVSSNTCTVRVVD